MNDIILLSGVGDLTETYQDVGIGKGTNYALNFPLRDGITDENYKSVFEPVRRSFYGFSTVT